MIKVAPSILSADFVNLERDIKKVSTADYNHVMSFLDSKKLFQSAFQGSYTVIVYSAAGKKILADLVCGVAGTFGNFC